MSAPAETSGPVPGTRRAQVLAYLKDHPGLTAGELSRALGRRGDLLDTLHRLERRALVVAVPAWEPLQGRNVCRWEVAPPGTIPPPRRPVDVEAARRRRERDRLAVRARRARARGTELPSLRTAAAAPLPGAACRTAGPHLFFPQDAETADARVAREARAKAVCASCPVRLQCYDLARANGEPWGIWGGVDFENRTEGRKAS